MTGEIATYQKCPKCQEKFERVSISAGFVILTCLKCHTYPTRFFIDLYWQGKRYRIARDKMGYLLSSADHANRLLEAIRYDIDQHRFDPSHYDKKELAPYRFNAFCQRWLNHVENLVKGGDKSSATLDKRQSQAKIFVKFFGNIDIRDIRTKDIYEFRAILTNYKLSTAKNILAGLSCMLRFARSLEMIERLPVFPQINVQKAPIQAITEETQERILNAIETYHQPIFRFLRATGCRPAMARALKWDCIDRENGVVVFRRNFSRDDKLTEVLKNRKVLYFPITSEIDSILSRIPRSLGGFVFTYLGKPYTHNFNKIWVRACKRIGVDITLYAGVRHSFATNLLERGVDLRDVADLMGHSSMNVTRNNYAQVKMKRLGDILEMSKAKTGQNDYDKNRTKP